MKVKKLLAGAIAAATLLTSTMSSRLITSSAEEDTQQSYAVSASESDSEGTTPEGMPEIVDTSGELPDSVKSLLWDAFAESYPDTDLSDFSLVYLPEEQYHTDEVDLYFFDTYYKGMYTYIGNRYESSFTEVLVYSDGSYYTWLFTSDFVEQCLAFDYTTLLSEEEVEGLLVEDGYLNPYIDTDIQLDLIIFNNVQYPYLVTLEEAVLAYCVTIGYNETGTLIIDAHSGELLHKLSDIDTYSSTTSSKASYWENDFEFTYQIVDGEIYVLSGNCKGSTLDLPDSISGYPLVSVAEAAFYNSDVTPDKIKISENVKVIEDNAFLGACGHGATEIILPESIESIGEKAFGYTANYSIAAGYIYTKLDNVIIYGYAGTVAETYAEENGFTFVPLNEETSTTEETTTTTTTTTTENSTTEEITTTITTAVTLTTETTSETGTTQTAETTTTNDFLPGDCNDDGLFSISDVVLLQKWLLNVSGTSLNNWEAADLCVDEQINAFDLCVMKQMLLGL